MKIVVDEKPKDCIECIFRDFQDITRSPICKLTHFGLRRIYNDETKKFYESPKSVCPLISIKELK